jgi:tRNA 2-thiouridine synthesizing protein A
MSDSDQPQETLDCIGLLCPEPLFQTREAMDALDEGDVLELFADDPAAEEDITRFAKRAGHEVISIEDQGEHKRFLIRKGR